MKQTKTEKYSVTLVIGDKTYRGSGATPFEALYSLQKPVKNMSKGILTVSHGDNTRSVPITPVRIKQLFFTGKSLLEVKAKMVFMNL